MQADVARKWHLPASDHGREFGENLLLLLKVVLVPVGQIHVAPGLPHVILYKPGHRRNVAVPGPIRSLRVAVLA